MSFGEQLKSRREALGMSRAALAERLGVTASAIGNYETGVSSPKEEVLLRLFDVLHTDPNHLFRGSFRAEGFTCTPQEENMLVSYRALSVTGRQIVGDLVRSLCAYQEEMNETVVPLAPPRTIPLYRSPAAAGYASPVCGEDFDLIPVDGSVPSRAEFAVRIQGDSMEPQIRDGGTVYVNRDPLENGDVGIFFVDGDILCKQYYRDPLGIVYLFSLNRARSDADVVFGADSGRTLACFGRVILPQRLPLPGEK